MYTIEHLNIQGIPTLKVEKAAFQEQPLPVVLFWHGWTSMKERNLYYAYLLAESGFRVILPEATGHGERLEELTELERQIGFFQVVLQSIHETAVIRDYGLEKGWIKDNQFMMAGTSMGAIITLSALATYDWVQSAVSLMGSPFLIGFAQHKLSQFKEAGITLPFSDEELDQLMKTLEPYDLSKHLDQLNGVPLLFWHGKKDPEVPYAQSRLFYDSYNYLPGITLSYIDDPNAEHVVTQEGALALRDWFVHHTPITQ